MSAELTLLHTNDLHDSRSVFPFLESRPRDSSTLLLDAGDAIRGSNTVFHFHEPMLEMMSRVGYDAMALGNREFHYLRAVLSRRASEATFPFVCSNVQDLRNKANHAWEPSLVKTVGRTRVGIIGLTPIQYRDESLWQPIMGFRFFSPTQVLPRLVAELRPRVDMLVLLSHSGFDSDCEVARAVEGIDVIVGGHSHTLLETPRFVSGTCIVQAGSHGRFVGEMALRIKGEGGVEVVDYRLVGVRVRRELEALAVECGRSPGRQRP